MDGGLGGQAKSLEKQLKPTAVWGGGGEGDDLSPRSGPLHSTSVMLPDLPWWLQPAYISHTFPAFPRYSGVPHEEEMNMSPTVCF